MATEVYRNCLKKFWKRMENVEVTLTTGVTDTWTGNIQRFMPNSGTTPGVVDYYFYDAGQALIRVLCALSYDEIYKISHELVVVKTKNLTSGVVSIDKNIAKIYDRLLVYTSTDKDTTAGMAYLMDSWERDEIVNGLNLRKLPSADQRYFEIYKDGSDLKIKCYPTTYDRVDLRFLKNCPLQVSGEGQEDPFPEILSDIWTDIACQIASGDMKDSLEQVIEKQLQQKFTFLSKPKITKTPNTREIVH